MHLSTAEKFELGAIPVATALFAWLAPRAGVRLEIGELLAGGALVILLQGFCRDLWLLRQSRRQPAAGSAREASCMCVESALGLTGVAAGIGLVGFGFEQRVVLSPALLAAGTGGTMLAGYLLKDFVFGWSPWKIYREKNHAQIIVRWRKQECSRWNASAGLAMTSHIASTHPSTTMLRSCFPERHTPPCGHPSC